MDSIEKNFRERPRNPIAIRHYAKSLLNAGHILESSFFCNLLLEEDKKGIEANKLGYQLAIRKMDKNVKEFDRQLFESGANKEDIYSLQLAYYFTFNDKVNMLKCANCLVNMELHSNEAFTILIDTIEHLMSYDLATKFIAYQYKRIRSTSNLDIILRKILMQRMCEIIFNLSRQH